MEPALAFGSVMRYLRRARDLTQEALAHESGMGRVHISRIERGEVQPTLTSIIRIAEALRISPEELFAAVMRKVKDVPDDILANCDEKNIAKTS